VEKTVYIGPTYFIMVSSARNLRQSLSTFTMNSILLLGLTLGVVALYALLEPRRRKARGQLPPGPSPLPIVGNIKDLPPKGKQDWVHWLEHKSTYGMVFKEH
jgi:hypothetical protein